MNSRDRELDLANLQKLLGKCLGRIDEHAFRLQEDGAVLDQETVADAIEDETGELQQIVDSIVEAAIAGTDERADLNAIVAHCVSAMLQEVWYPLVVRQRLDAKLPLVAGSTGMITHAVHRALALAASHAGSGGEVSITTRTEACEVLFELQCPAGASAQNLEDRAMTLRAFVAQFQGRCEVSVDSTGGFWLALELPVCTSFDQRR